MSKKRRVGESSKRKVVRGEPVIRKVLAATLEEVARAGYHGLRIEDVATRAGVNKTTVYRRWPTKQELVREALLSITTEAFTAPKTGSLRGDIGAIAHRTVELARKPEYQGLFRIMLSGGDDDELREIVDGLRDTLGGMPMEVLAAAEARGEIASGIDPIMVFEVLSATINWWVFVRRSGAEESQLQALIELLLHGLVGPRDTARPMAKTKPRARTKAKTKPK
ncbi:TetR/AcrR family transcriptional regulator [Pseudenhygromyxa sp. WMMC2535]|nr:TetR/AcrR family transcriptional regulator [Pseudenhygromyxa sp. WMMC2535]NVB42510.1 TetR/AcrR family transcriptional regulator [Pseudenhygromyxa sp. WMMC2535]